MKVILKTKKIYYCKNNCGNKISYNNFIYGKKQCKKCYVKTLKGKGNPAYKDGITLKKHYCRCGEEIHLCTVLRNKKKKSVGFCKKCFSKLERNGNWQNGIGFLPYSIKFNDDLKLKIRTRDNFKCQNCGMTEEEHKRKFNRVHHVHHIDYNKMNCKENNLITLCLIDNVKANKNRKYWIKFYKKIMKNNK